MSDEKKSSTDGQFEKAIDELEAAGTPTLRVECGALVPGHADEWIDFKRYGWKYKHLRRYESITITDELMILCFERIQNWNLTDAEGNAVPFQPWRLDPVSKEPIEGQYSSEGADELEPDVAGFIVSAFRTAYNLSSTPEKKE